MGGPRPGRGRRPPRRNPGPLIAGPLALLDGGGGGGQGRVHVAGRGLVLAWVERPLNGSRTGVIPVRLLAVGAAGGHASGEGDRVGYVGLLDRPGEEVRARPVGIHGHVFPAV